MPLEAAHGLMSARMPLRLDSLGRPAWEAGSAPFPRYEGPVGARGEPRARVCAHVAQGGGSSRFIISRVYDACGLW